MRIHVTRAYLDLARGVIDTQGYGDPDAPNREDSLFALMSCTYVFSFMALTAFCASHLHKRWEAEDSRLRAKFDGCTSFEELMGGPLKELKKALNELADQLGIDRLHKAKPAVWRELNELLKRYRDYFVHPNPERFHDHLEATANLEWGFPSRVASEVIQYYFEATGSGVPGWVNNPGLRCRGFDVVGI